MIPIPPTDRTRILDSAKVLVPADEKHLFSAGIGEFPGRLFDVGIEFPIKCLIVSSRLFGITHAVTGSRGSVLRIDTPTPTGTM